MFFHKSISIFIRATSRRAKAQRIMQLTQGVDRLLRFAETHAVRPAAAAARRHCGELPVAGRRDCCRTAESESVCSGAHLRRCMALTHLPS